MQVLAEEGHSARSLRGRKPHLSENLSSLQQNLTSVSAFQLIRLQKPAVYSAAVTTKRWEAEPSFQKVD